MSILSPSATLAPNCSIADLIAQHRGAMSPKPLSPLLDLSAKTLYAKVKKGTIPSMNFDGAIKFDPYTTAVWVRSKCA